MNKKLNVLSEITDTNKSEYIRSVLKNYINRSKNVKEMLGNNNNETNKECAV